MRRLPARALAVAAGLAAARLTPEPDDLFHPVAAFGRLMAGVEQRLWRDDRRAGVAYAAIGTAVGSTTGLVLRRVAPATALTVAGRQLRLVAHDIATSCEAGDVDGARARLPALVGRDPSDLDVSGISAAVVESLAENSVDAVVAPAVWALLGGAPGALAYRAVNTMDAMVGHHTPRYERFGWAAARLDDAANYVPARLFVALVAVTERTRAAAIARAVLRDGPGHPSPNAGVAEAAVAAAIGRRLGGPLSYAGRIEHRPHLGSGPRPGPADIRRAIRITDRAELALIGALLAVAAIGSLRGRR